MKAVRLVHPGQPLRMQDLPVPDVGSRDVLIRVKAAGICHSDAHYRAGISAVRPLPRTLGHEIAGVVEKCGTDVVRLHPGNRVCVHYMATCGDCEYCNRGVEQFCTSGKMIGKHRDGGYAEYICVPARCAFTLPSEIPWEHGAILMCSSATSLHALNKARLRAGETVAVFGAGGLGMSAIQLARAFGARQVFAVDIQESKLEMAQRLGAVPINSTAEDPVEELRDRTGGRGVDVALELIGLPQVMRQAVRSLSVLGRLSIAGITDQSFDFAPYEDLLGREAEIIGVSDHLAQEIPQLIDFVLTGGLRLSDVVTQTVSLDADEVNAVLNDLENFRGNIRAVITPQG
ncbi:MAG TPA: zinc-binding dehydrogenase [Acidobacteriota bacterium]|nr:zinc-binding dehydrogenase [Acidobacteriota bacterium]